MYLGCIGDIDAQRETPEVVVRLERMPSNRLGLPLELRVVPILKGVVCGEHRNVAVGAARCADAEAQQKRDNVADSITEMLQNHGLSISREKIA